MLLLLCIPLWLAAVSGSAYIASSVAELGDFSSDADVFAYWTKERLLSAIPREIMLDGAGPRVDASAPMVCSAYSETLWTNAANYTRPPLPLVGRLYFSIGADNYVCSGSVMNNDTVWTAGHCVYDPDVGIWATNAVFIPQYFEGTFPWGLFRAIRLFTTIHWANYGDLGRDCGVVRINGSFPAAIGRLTLRVNIASPAATIYTSYGYPAAYPFDGEYDNSCNSTGCHRDTRVRPVSVGISCSSTPGCSGGPWIVGGTQLASINSYSYLAQPGVMYGPYFDTAIANFWNTVKEDPELSS
jgi:V8-like Glu-specific endopeptidase